MDEGDATGGSAALASLIDRYGEVLVPDLKHYYQVDLRDLFREEEPLTPRYVLSLINALPVGSAFEAERRGGQQFRGWDETRYALVAIANTLQAIQYLYTRVHIDPKKSAKPKPPEPFPTPDAPRDRSRPKPGSFGHVAATMMAATRRRKAGS